MHFSRCLCPGCTFSVKSPPTPGSAGSLPPTQPRAEFLEQQSSFVVLLSSPLDSVLTEGEKGCDLSLNPQPGWGALIQCEVQGGQCLLTQRLHVLPDATPLPGMRPHMEKLPEVGGVCREAFPHLTRVRPGSRVCNLWLHTDLSKATWLLF